MGRNIAAAVAGVLVAVGLVWLVEMIGHSIYPPPPNLDFSDADAVRKYAAELPLGAFLFVGGGWFLGTLGGTVTACQIGTRKPIIFAVIVGGLMLVATAINLATFPHPIAFSISGIAAIVIAAWLGMRVGQRINAAGNNA